VSDRLSQSFANESCDTCTFCLAPDSQTIFLQCIAPGGLLRNLPFYIPVHTTSTICLHKCHNPRLRLGYPPSRFASGSAFYAAFPFLITGTLVKGSNSRLLRSSVAHQTTLARLFNQFLYSCFIDFDSPHRLGVYVCTYVYIHIPSIPVLLHSPNHKYSSTSYVVYSYVPFKPTAVNHERHEQPLLVAVWYSSPAKLCPRDR
jgi:hypothetical protein